MKKGLIVFLVVVLVAILQISYFMKGQASQEVASEAIYFVVESVEARPDATYSFYDAAGNAFKSYTFDTPEVIKKGDIIAKEANSSELTVYRFDSDGNKEVVLRINEL